MFKTENMCVCVRVCVFMKDRGKGKDKEREGESKYCGYMCACAGIYCNGPVHRFGA